MYNYTDTGGLYTDVGQWQQQRKRKQIQEQVKEYASNLQGDAGLIPTNLQMQTAAGEKVDVNLYPSYIRRTTTWRKQT